MDVCARTLVRACVFIVLQAWEERRWVGWWVRVQMARPRWRKEEERGDHIAAADTSPTSVPASPQCAHHQTEYCTLHTWQT